MGEQVELLEDHAGFHADLFDIADIVGQLDAIDDDLPVLVLFQPVDGADKGRFARPGRAEDHDDLTFLDFHGYAFQGMEVPVPFVDIPADDDRLIPRWFFSLIVHGWLPRA